MNNKRFVYFDLGNVLVNFDHQIAVNQLAQLADRSAELVRSVVFDSQLQDRYETGLVTSLEFANEINQQLGTRLSTPDILESVSAIFALNDPMIAVLERLKSLGIAMGVLSNTCEAHWEWVLRQNWGLPGNWFRWHVLSYQVHSMKPHSKIYEVCETYAGCDPGQIFFTDDRAENIEAAHTRGWQTYHYRSTDELSDRLSAWMDAGSA